MAPSPRSDSETWGTLDARRRCDSLDGSDESLPGRERVAREGGTREGGLLLAVGVRCACGSAGASDLQCVPRTLFLAAGKLRKGACLAVRAAALARFRLACEEASWRAWPGRLAEAASGPHSRAACMLPAQVEPAQIRHALVPNTSGPVGAVRGALYLFTSAALLSRLWTVSRGPAGATTPPVPSGRERKTVTGI